ncbi:hypothetical protein Tco_0829758 [Tanacetum coccineum]
MYDILYVIREEAEGRITRKFPKHEEQVLHTMARNDAGTSQVLRKEKPIMPRAWRLYIGRGMRKEGLGVGMILVGPDENTSSYAIRLNFNALEENIDYEALLAELVATARKEGHKIPSMMETKRFREEVMDATVPFHRFRITYLPKAANPKAEFLIGLATIKLEFLNQTVSIGIKTRPSMEAEGKRPGDVAEKATTGKCLRWPKRFFDAALRSALERIVTAYGPGFGDWQWRLATLPFAFGGLGVYCASDVLNYAFLASRLQSTSLQTKLLRHSSIVASGPAFNDALCAFNTKMETDLLSNASEITAPKLMKKLADIYFTRVTQTAESTFSLSSRQIALWQSQMEDHTSDWLRAVLISGLGQTMNGDIYGDHVVSCAGIIGIKHRHNVVRDTLVDICFRSGISAGKEVDIGLGGGCDKPLRPADMLLYSWDEGLDVYVDLTGSSPLTQTGMVDFVPSHAVIDATHRKRVKYEAKCANIGYGFLPFSFSSLEELEKDAVNLLKRIRKFSVTQDIGARAAVYIFRINFAIAKGVRAQLVSRVPTNFL